MVHQDDETNPSLWPNAVKVSITWAETADERGAAQAANGKAQQGQDVESGEQEATVKVLPELKLPPAVERRQSNMGNNENVHPFWAITRHAKIEDVTNCATSTTNLW